MVRVHKPLREKVSPWFVPHHRRSTGRLCWCCRPPPHPQPPRSTMTIPNVIPLQRPDLMMNEYVAHGFALCPIPPGSKGPNTQGWNSLDNAVTKPDVIPFGHGCGLLHSFSGTMALDVDNMDHAEMLLACHGINLQDLLNAPDAVQVISVRAGHGKLIYKMPSGLVLPSKQVKLIGVALELRCATANGLSVQDILPPSIHPDTKQAYTWGGAGDWRKLPMIPEALLKVWEGLVAKDARRTIHTGAPIRASWRKHSNCGMSGVRRQRSKASIWVSLTCVVAGTRSSPPRIVR